MLAGLLFFKKSLEEFAVRRISSAPHRVLFGLGETAEALLANERAAGRAGRYVVVEKEEAPARLEPLRRAGTGVLVHDALDEGLFDRLDFEQMEGAMITLGDDRLNMELAVRLVERYQKEDVRTPIKLLVHLRDRRLESLFHESFILPRFDPRHPIDVATFSWYDEAAESLFDTAPVEGETARLVENGDPFHLTVLGTGELAANLVAEAAERAHLPEQNPLHIHLVGREAERFAARLRRRYPGIDRVVTLHPHPLDEESPAFVERHEEDHWSLSPMPHVVVCHDDENANVKLAIDLFDRVYRAEAADGTLEPRIDVALFHTYSLHDQIDADGEMYDRFHSFARAARVCTYENIFEERHDTIAKLIHYGYAEEYDPMALHDLSDPDTREKIDAKWYGSASLHDKLSSRAQAKHIDIKLKALGLARRPAVDFPIEELLADNRKLLDEKLATDRQKTGVDDALLHRWYEELRKSWSGEPFEVPWFPTRFETTFEKLIRAEHERWNAFHYLQGWRHAPKTDKRKKEHACLKPLHEFVEPELQLTILYDIYAILYIPNYLAAAGYAVVSLEEKEEKKS